MSRKFIISTDLDGTLLDHHDYSWAAAMPALSFCKALEVPVILNTSKTQAEVDVIGDELNLAAPMIVENGSVMLIPSHLMTEEIPLVRGGPAISLGKRNLRLEFGVERGSILNFIGLIRADQSWQFEGFNDWSVDEIAERTGLSSKAADAAAQKRYSEPFVWNDSQENLLAFEKRAKAAGFDMLKGGRFYHLQGQTDKAKPLLWLRKNASTVFTSFDANTAATLVCLGDSHNDIAMLNIADFPVRVRSPVADYPVLSTDKPVVSTQLYGPEGWNDAILEILDTPEPNTATKPTQN